MEIFKLLGKNNRRTTIITAYRPCLGSIETAEISTILKQQWLVLQYNKGEEHHIVVAINDLIKVIQICKKEKHEIILSFDGNE